MKKETEDKLEKTLNYIFDYLEEYAAAFLGAAFVAYGILELQTLHYIEEEYQHIGWYIIGFGICLFLWGQWGFSKKRKKKHEDTT